MDEEANDVSALGRLLKNRWFQTASALGVVLGILGFVLGLPPVADTVFGKRMSLSLNVVSQIPVFAVRQPVPGLSMALNDQDLTSARQDLVVARVRLENTGEVSVNARNTTASDPLGFSISGGRVVRLNEVTATSLHLRKLAVPQRIGNSFVLPPGLIIDPGDYVQFDLLIVRPVNQAILFHGLGKVEGLKAVTTILASLSPPNPGALSTAWSGSLVAQILRILTYPFIAVACIAAVIVPISSASSLMEKRRRGQRERFGRIARASLEEVDPKLRKLIPLLYASIGRERMKSLTGDDFFLQRTPTPRRSLGAGKTKGVSSLRFPISKLTKQSKSALKKRLFIQLKSIFFWEDYLC